MDKIWDRKSFEVRGHWLLWREWKNRMTTQNQQKLNAEKNTKKQKNFYIVQAIRCSQVYCIRSNKIVLKELFHDYIHILHDL